MDLSEPFIRLGRLPGYSWGSWPWFLQPSYLFIVGSISPPAVYCGLRSLHCRPGAVPASFDFPDIYPPTSCLDGNIASIRMDCDAVSRFGCLTPALSEPCRKDMGFVQMSSFNHFRNYFTLRYHFYLIVNFNFSTNVYPTQIWRGAYHGWMISIPYKEFNISYLFWALYGAFNIIVNLFWTKDSKRFYN